MEAEKPSWVFWSTRDSVNDGVISVSALIETLIAVPLYWWLAIHFETYLLLLISAVVAPLVLLRSDESVALGVQWFTSFERVGWPKSEVQASSRVSKLVSWTAVVACLALYLAGFELAIRYVAGVTEGWTSILLGCFIGWTLWSSVFAFSSLFEAVRPKTDKGLVVLPLALAEAATFFLIAGMSVGWRLALAVAAGMMVTLFTFSLKLPYSLSLPLNLSSAMGIPVAVLLFSLVARIFATFRFLGAGLKSLSTNFFRLVLCTSPSQVPELVPGLEANRSIFALSYVWENLRSRIEFRDGYAGGIFVFVSSIVFWFLPAWLYRLTLKSTAWLWWPIAFLGAPPNLALNPDWFYAQRMETRWAKSTATLAYLSIAAFLVGGVWQTVDQGEALNNPFLNVLGYAFSVSWSSAPWQLLGFLGSVLTLVVVYLTDWTFTKYIVATRTMDEGLRDEAKRQMRVIEHLSRLRVIVFLAYCAIVGFHAVLVLNAQACWISPAASVQRWSQQLYRQHAPAFECRMSEL